MSLWSRISNALFGERLHREIEEELQSHIEEAIASGRDPKEAHRAFGSALHAREASHSIRVAGWLESLLADVRFGWRQLCRNKVTSVAAVLSLALGIGSCVAAFRLIDALLWRPLPIARSSSLYALSRKLIGPDGKPMEDGHWATPEFKLMRDAVKDQADLIAISDSRPRGYHLVHRRRYGEGPRRLCLRQHVSALRPSARARPPAGPRR